MVATTTFPEPVPTQFYSEQSDAGNGSVLSGELVLAAPWDLHGINGIPPQSFTILIRGRRSSGADVDNYIIRRQDLNLAPGTVLDDYAVDVSLNGQPSATNIAFNSGSRPFGDPPNPFGNYSELVGLSVSGSNYLRYTLSGSSFFGLTVKGGSPVLDYSLELSFVYRPAPTVIPKLSVFSRSASVQFEGNSGLTHYIFTIHRNGLTSGVTTVGWAIAGAGGNPATTNDFAPGSTLSGVLTFLPTETEKIITVQVAGDTTFEPDEAFDLILSGASAGAEIIRASQRAVISNDDAAPPPATLAISPASADKAEGTGSAPTPFTFTVSRSGDTSSTSTALWTVAGSGAHPASSTDFTGGALPTGTVSFAAGQTSATITLGINADSTIEPDEAFLVTLSNASGGSLTTATASGTIRNDDIPAPPPPPPPPPPAATLAIVVTTNGAEAGPAPTLFTITRTGDLSASLPVDWSLSGTVVRTIDFSGPTSGQIVFQAGSRLATLSIPTLDDSFTDPGETLTITLVAPPGTTVAPGGALSATAIQIDDESIAPGVTNVVFGGHDGRLALGEGITLTVTFNRAVVAGTGVDLPGILLNNGGRAGYVSGSGSNQLVFSYIAAAGQSTPALATATANALAGTIQDLAGNAVVSSGLNNRRPTGTLRVDTLAPTITGFAFSRNRGSLPLGTPLTLTVTFSETVVVPVSPAPAPSLLLNSGGRATYVSGSGTNQLVFTYVPATSQFSTALATANANALSGTIRDLAGNAVVSSGFNNRRPTGTLRVDTLAPTITGFAFSRNSGSLPLGTPLTLTVTFSETVVVPGSTALLPSLLLNSGGRATYVSGSGTNKLIFTHTITKGQLSSALATATTNALSGAIRDLTGNAVVSSGFNNRKPTGTLMVDTRPRQLTIAQTRDGHEQGAVTAVFTLSRTGPRSSPLTVAYTLGGSATPGSDYSGAGAGTVTFPVGSDTTTLTLPVADDSEAEGEELIIARITAPVGYTLVPGFEKADALLIDNDPVTGLAGGAPMPLKASLSPFAAAPTLATPTPATPLLQHTPWAGGMDLEPMQAVSPLAILRVAEPPA